MNNYWLKQAEEYKAILLDVQGNMFDIIKHKEIELHDDAVVFKFSCETRTESVAIVGFSFVRPNNTACAKINFVNGPIVLNFGDQFTLNYRIQLIDKHQHLSLDEIIDELQKQYEMANNNE